MHPLPPLQPQRTQSTMPAGCGHHMGGGGGCPSDVAHVVGQTEAEALGQPGGAFLADVARVLGAVQRVRCLALRLHSEEVCV